MLSFREADIFDHFEPTTMLVKFELKNGSFDLKWLGPSNERYNTTVWERITYLKKHIKKLIRRIENNHDLKTFSQIAGIFHTMAQDLRKDSKIISVRPLQFSAPEMEIEVIIQ